MMANFTYLLTYSLTSLLTYSLKETISIENDRAETMRACAPKVSKIERWKTNNSCYRKSNRGKKIRCFDLKMLTYGNLCMENIDNMLHIFFSFLSSFFYWEKHSCTQNFLCKIERMKWLIKSQQRQFLKYSCH